MLTDFQPNYIMVTIYILHNFSLLKFIEICVIIQNMFSFEKVYIHWKGVMGYSVLCSFIGSSLQIFYMLIYLFLVCFFCQLLKRVCWNLLKLLGVVSYPVALSLFDLFWNDIWKCIFWIHSNTSTTSTFTNNNTAETVPQTQINCGFIVIKIYLTK